MVMVSQATCPPPHWPHWQWPETSCRTWHLPVHHCTITNRSMQCGAGSLTTFLKLLFKISRVAVCHVSYFAGYLSSTQLLLWTMTVRGETRPDIRSPVITSSRYIIIIIIITTTNMDKIIAQQFSSLLHSLPPTFHMVKLFCWWFHIYFVTSIKATEHQRPVAELSVVLKYASHKYSASLLWLLWRLWAYCGVGVWRGGQGWGKLMQSKASSG